MESLEIEYIITLYGNMLDRVAKKVEKRCYKNSRKHREAARIKRFASMFSRWGGVGNENNIKFEYHCLCCYRSLRAR